MFVSKIALLLLGTIAAVSQGAVYPSLSISNNFAVTGMYGLAGSPDANGNPVIATL